MQPNILSYNETEFRDRFQQTEIYQQLSQDFDHISFDNTVDWDLPPTPRERLATRRQSLFSAVSFYYLEFLTKHNPKQILDIGCGANYFKRYIPNIVGMGAEPLDNYFYRGDVHGEFNHDWAQANQGKLESFFSICSLHFVPLNDLRQRMLEIASTLAPNGRAYIAMNTARMCERMWWHQPSEKHLFGQSVDVHTADRIIREQLSNMPFTYEVFDIDITVSCHKDRRDDYCPKFDNMVDGNIRMVIWNNKT
jgi:hypothetical protein